MANKTKSLGLTKPLAEEDYNVKDFNDNADKLDDYAETTSESIANLKANMDNHTHRLEGTSIIGVLPISKGGTGATTASVAAKNLGLEGLVKTCYVVAASDSDENLKRYADFLCTGENNGGNYILKIINEVPDNSTLYFLPGTYNISHIFLTVNKPITLTGAENGSTEFVLLGGACVRIGTEKEINNVCIKNITLKSERGEAYVGASLIRIDDVNKLRIENVTLEETIPSKVANVTAPATIIIKNSAKNMIVTGCRIKTNYSDFYNSYYAVDVQSETANSMIIGSTLVGSDGFRFNVKSKENTSYEQFGNLDFQLYIDGVKQTKEVE